MDEPIATDAEPVAIEGGDVVAEVEETIAISGELSVEPEAVVTGELAT